MNRDHAFAITLKRQQASAFQLAILSVSPTKILIFLIYGSR